jgi:hypothetical protein
MLSRLPARIFTACAVLAVAGCSNTASNINVEDTTTVIPTLRIAADFGDRPGARSRPHTSHAVEFGLSGATGDDTVEVAAGQQPIIFGGESYAVPQQIRAEFDFRFIELAYRYRYVSQRGALGVEGLAGLAQARLGLRLIGPTRTAAERLDGTGLVLGVGGILRLWPSGSVQLRATGFASTTSEGVSSVARYDLQLAQALGRHAAIRAGYAFWDVRSRREDDAYSRSNDSPIRVKFSGPTLGLELMF